MYRNFANSSARYQAKLRDRDIDQRGVKAWIRINETEEKRDFYGDLVVERRSTRRQISLIPLYEQYYNVVDLMGSDIELQMPLQCIVRVQEHIPNESVIELPLRTDDGKLVANWWTVLSTKIKHLERRYSRVAYLTPTREPVENFERETHPITAQSSVSVEATVIHA